jgi:hypothetical protein
VGLWALVSASMVIRARRLKKGVLRRMAVSGKGHWRRRTRSQLRATPISISATEQPRCRFNKVTSFADRPGAGDREATVKPAPVDAHFFSCFNRSGSLWVSRPRPRILRLKGMDLRLMRSKLASALELTRFPVLQRDPLGSGEWKSGEASVGLVS